MKGEDMSIHVTDFKWEKGKNDLQYIELLEKTLKNEQAITAKAIAKIRELSAENKEIRNKAIDEFASELENHSIYADTGKGDEVKMEWASPVTRIKEVADQMKGAVQ